jgi:hypothetical protein
MSPRHTKCQTNGIIAFPFAFSAVHDKCYLFMLPLLFSSFFHLNLPVTDQRDWKTTAPNWRVAATSLCVLRRQPGLPDGNLKLVLPLRLPDSW